MIERIISEDCFWDAIEQSYRAGADCRSLYTMRGINGPKVIRCKHCKYCDELIKERSDRSRHFCMLHMNNRHKPREVRLIDFCSWGERDDNE